MKKILYILPILALLPCAVSAQTSTENYVMTETLLNASGTSMKAVQYYNGLGYPTVGVATTGGNGQTSYTLTTYDALGREECQYLPVDTDKVDYRTPNTIIAISKKRNKDDNTAYTRNHYDALDRVVSTELPGQAWRTADKRNTMAYAANTAADKVKRYEAKSTNTTLTDLGQNYAAGKLTKETSADADGKKVETFKDLFGNVILQRVGGSQDTYYVYDELGRLRFVLSPEYQNNKNKAISGYEYRYDERGRVITKILPGAEYIEYWHDTADRVICMQDAMMRKAGKYRFTIYDQFGRVAIQGMCTNYKNKSSHDANPTVTATYTPSSAGFLNTGYTVSNGTTLFTGATLEVVNYYDKLDFVSKNFGSRFAGLSAPSSSDATGQLTGSAVLAGNGEWVAQAMGYDLRGNLTETRSRELKRGTTARVATRTNTYTYTNNLKSSTCTVGVAYGNNLSLTETYEYNTKNDKKSSYNLSIAHGNTAVSSKTTYAYTPLGQLKTVTRPFTGSATKTVTYTYDMRGWLTGITTNSFAEELFYADGPGTKLYNGNISSMRWKNGSYSSVKRGYKFTYDAANRLKNAVYGEKDNLGTNANRFTEKVLEYDKNGNIKRLERRGRMQNGKYGLVDSLIVTYTGNQLKTVKDMANKVTYAGSLDFKGTKGTAYSYTYNENGSLLTDQSRGIAFISYDLSGNPQKIYFTNGSITKYVYSATGQKLRMVHYTAKANITRTIGQQVELKASEIQSTDSTDYLLGGSLVVRNGKIDKYLFDGGYAQATASGTTDKFTFYYQNKDHLGTVRETVTSTGAMKQRVNYYPFGGQFVDTLKVMIWNRDFQQYKYNGKEFDGTFGLNTYDYGARQHDPILARWDRIDPLCEKYYGISPYAYCADNPVKYIDPDGSTIIPVVYNSIDENAHAIGQRYRSNTRVIDAMTKFGQTSYGKKLIGSFLPKGGIQYGVKGTGEYANYILKIKQFNTDENWRYTGELPGSVKSGSLVPSEENGTLMFTLLIDLRNNGSNSQLLETIIHELCLHGYKIEDLIKAYKKGGIDAVKELWNQDPGGEKEHRALKEKDMAVPGVECYYSTINELVGPDRELLEMGKFGDDF
ncbi:MAG: RHS repeat-associated core domain-containing protein [Prevotella sp.]|nr:RHS repeat-associated core domain-containing protein [Prevotella sp.]